MSATHRTRTAAFSRRAALLMSTRVTAGSTQSTPARASWRRSLSPFFRVSGIEPDEVLHVDDAFGATTRRLAREWLRVELPSPPQYQPTFEGRDVSSQRPSLTYDETVAKAIRTTTFSRRAKRLLPEVEWGLG